MSEAEEVAHSKYFGLYTMGKTKPLEYFKQGEEGKHGHICILKGSYLLWCTGKRQSTRMNTARLVNGQNQWIKDEKNLREVDDEHKEK